MCFENSVRTPTECCIFLVLLLLPHAGMYNFRFSVVVLVQVFGAYTDQRQAIEQVALGGALNSCLRIAEYSYYN